METIIKIKIDIECGISRAFSMFTSNSLLETWLTGKADVESKVGGKYELFWEPDNKDRNSTLGCKITGMEKNAYLSFNWKGPIQFQSFMNTAEPLTHVIVFFAKNDENPEKTIIYLFHTGWKEDDKWQEARNYFEKAWINALSQLKNIVKKSL